MSNLYEKAGGAHKLRRVLEDFYERLFADLMIGFLFAGKDKERLIQKELELVSEFLGGDLRYSGRPMRAAHEKLPILGGHYHRRLQILRETMADHELPKEVQEQWLAHTESLKDQVLRSRT